MSGYVQRHRNEQQGPCEIHAPFSMDYGRWKASKLRWVLDSGKSGRLLRRERALYLCYNLLLLHTSHYGRWKAEMLTTEAVVRVIANECPKVLHIPLRSVDFDYGRLKSPLRSVELLRSNG